MAEVKCNGNYFPGENARVVNTDIAVSRRNEMIRELSGLSISLKGHNYAILFGLHREARKGVLLKVKETTH